MSFKPFAVHFNRGRRKYDNAKTKALPVGFTAWIEPVEDDHRSVNLRIVHCAYHDDFNKKLGIEHAKQMPDNIINKRDVPEYLAAAFNYAVGCRGTTEQYYHWVWKYLL